MASLDEKLKDILAGTFGAESLQFEISPELYVSGTITSADFSEKGNFERQEYVWSLLEESLSEEEKSHIVSLVTLTPEEKAAVH